MLVMKKRKLLANLFVKVPVNYEISENIENSQIPREEHIYFIITLSLKLLENNSSLSLL